MENDFKRKNYSSLTFRELTISNLSFAFLSALMSSLFTVLLFTNLVGFISQELWKLPIEWPIILYLGAMVGSIIGSFITLLEIKLIKLGNRKFIPAKLLSNDLFYIGGLFLLTYILETLSENIFSQIVLFLLEIGWFIILGWNISKMSLESIKKLESHIDDRNHIDDSSPENDS